MTRLQMMLGYVGADIVAEAAALAGMEPHAWVQRAVREQARHEAAMAKHRVVMANVAKWCQEQTEGFNRYAHLPPEPVPLGDLMRAEAEHLTLDRVHKPRSAP